MREIFAIALSLSKTLRYSAKKTAIDRAGGFDQFFETVDLKSDHWDLQTAEKQFLRLQNHKGWLWIYGDRNYPPPFMLIPDPPLVIYGVGISSFDFDNILAFVGTRRPTSYGERAASNLAKEIVQGGLTIVSGLAQGIDSIGHKAALQFKQPTIAVLAHGLDRTYPPEHKRMRDEICKMGAVISEFPFGITPRPEYFPQRNRIISGLSQGVLVIEAGEKSGTRLTVNHALDQSREVFAVPGPIDSSLSIYTNKLISQGAIMVRSALDVLSVYPLRKPLQIDQVRANTIQLDSVQQKILISIQKYVQPSMEDILNDTDMEIKFLLQGLTALELHGMIKKQSDLTYSIATPHD